MSEHQRRLDRLADALVDDILALPADELLVEFAEDHGDPEQHAAEMRTLIARTVARQRRTRPTIFDMFYLTEGRSNPYRPRRTCLHNMPGHSDDVQCGYLHIHRKQSVTCSNCKEAADSCGCWRELLAPAHRVYPDWSTYNAQQDRRDAALNENTLHSSKQAMPDRGTMNEAATNE